MNYENYLIREMTEGETRGDTNCSDCGQVICACESLAQWHDEREANHAFSDWLDANCDQLPLPESFTQWLDQTGDKI